MEQPLDSAIQVSNPLYVSLQTKRPLPLHPHLATQHEEFQELESAGDQSDLSSEEDEEEKSFLPKESSSSKSKSSKSSSKKKKKRRSKTGGHTEDSDSETGRRALAESVHHNRKVQRLDKHPIMAKGLTRACAKGSKGGQSARKGNETTEEDTNQTQKENAELKLKLASLQKQMKLQRTGDNGGGRTTNQAAMSKEVVRVTKKSLWKVCKFIKSEKKLRKATRFVMKQLELAELEGLEGEELMQAEEEWIFSYQDDVRRALNKQRNYVQQELRDLMEEVFRKGEEAAYPNVKEMEALVLRDKMDDKTDKEERQEYQDYLIKYWNELMPKVAGHHAWGPGKRHHDLLSYATFESDQNEKELLVTPSDEAFLVTIWMNCYPKWLYKTVCKRGKKEPNESAPEMITPFTNAKSGQKKFGGWLPEGWDYYEKQLESIKENRENQKDYVKAVEEQALEKIRILENVVDKDGKVQKKPSGKRKAHEMDDDDEDEDDFEKW